MKIVLDLKSSYNNYNWENEEKLKNWIENGIKKELWNLYNNKDSLESNNLSVEESNRLYDLLDMFEKYEIIKEN